MTRMCTTPDMPHGLRNMDYATCVILHGLTRVDGDETAAGRLRIGSR